MITNDKGIVELKHFILREICRLAWEDRLTQEETEKIVCQVSPGPKPQYRCCVYKEREIVRGRIRLALGQSPDLNHPTGNVVAVIPAACDDCPIQDYSVTDICRFCLGKACLNACHFGFTSPCFTTEGQSEQSMPEYFSKAAWQVAQQQAPLPG